MAIRPITEVVSLRDRAYEEIKKEIVKLGFRPGLFLSISDLARQLEVSRTPVRDALLRLEREGWVRVLPFKGAYVAEISVKDVEDVFELLIVLEGEMARSAAEKVTDAEVRKAETLLARSQEVIAAGQMATAPRLWAEFHALLESAADNPRMLDIIKQMRLQCIRIRHFASVVPERVALSYEQHRLILDAVKRRDPAAAQKLMMSHQMSVRDSILATVRAIDGGATQRSERNAKRAAGGGRLMREVLQPAWRPMAVSGS